MKIVLIGIPGAGKSTQGNMLSKQLHLPYLSTGHIFRQISNEKSKLGRYVRDLVSAGFLIPDKKTLDIVEEYLKRPEYKKGYILDGFPRTISQAKEFVNGIEKVVYIEIADKEALWRIAYRNNDDSRQDDTVAAFKKRIDIFHKITTPVIDYYEKKNILAVVDGALSIHEVNKQILKSLGKQLIKNQIKDWQLKDKIIIAIVGLHGAGKTEATSFFGQKNLPIVSFGKAINDYIDEHKMTHNEANHNNIRMKFRKEYGMEALAVVNKKYIDKAFEKNKIIVIDGLRSFEEYLYLKKNYSTVELVIVAIWADRSMRSKRIKARAYRNNLTGKDRDYNEVLKANIVSTHYA